jgi:hypothetical protein
MTRHHPPHLQLVVADGQEMAGACHHVARRFRSLEELGLDRIEQLTLAVLRHLCHSFASETTLGWERANQLAEAGLGLGDGPDLVAQVTALLRAVRAERTRRFSYMAAECPICSKRITHDEHLVIRLIRAARANAQPRLTEHAVALAQKQQAPAITAAAHALGGRLATYALYAELQLPVVKPAIEQARPDAVDAVVPFPNAPHHAD